MRGRHRQGRAHGCAAAGRPAPIAARLHAGTAATRLGAAGLIGSGWRTQRASFCVGSRTSPALAEHWSSGLCVCLRVPASARWLACVACPGPAADARPAPIQLAASSSPMQSPPELVDGLPVAVAPELPCPVQLRNETAPAPSLAVDATALWDPVSPPDCFIVSCPRLGTPFVRLVVLDRLRSHGFVSSSFADSDGECTGSQCLSVSIRSSGLCPRCGALPPH